MEIRIEWINPNEDEDGIRIYRNTVPIDLARLPEVYAELSPGATEFIDVGVTRGEIYYYRVETHKAGSRIFSDNICVKATTNLGPGPQELQAGDWELGYFGTVSDNEFITASYLAQQLAYEGSRTLIAQSLWLKVAYKGKILFISKTGIAYNVIYNQLYAAGLVYGTDDTGLVTPQGAAPMNQLRLVNVAGDDFIVRLLKGVPEDLDHWPEFTERGDMLLEPLASNEWDDIFSELTHYPHYVGDSGNGRFGNYFNELIGYDTTGVVGALCQQIPLSDTEAIARGYRPSQSSNSSTSSYGINSNYAIAMGLVLGLNPSSGSRLSRSVRILGSNINTSTNVFALWRPVLEFIE